MPWQRHGIGSGDPEGLKQEGKPNVVIANTTKGAGISFIRGRPEWHHRVPKGEEIALALEELKDE